METFGKNKKLAMVIAILGIVLIIPSTIDYFRKLKSYEFIETNGYIDSFERIPRTKGGIEISIKYSYKVQGITYRNDIVGYGVGSPQKFERAYNERNKVDVFYNKNNISESVLVRGVSIVYLFGTFVGAVLLLNSLIMGFKGEIQKYGELLVSEIIKCIDTNNWK